MRSIMEPSMHICFPMFPFPLTSQMGMCLICPNPGVLLMKMDDVGWQWFMVDAEIVTNIWATTSAVNNRLIKFTHGKIQGAPWVEP